MRLTSPTGADLKEGSRNAFQLFIFSIILIIYGLLFMRPINLVVSDLGRHLKNGEIFFKYFSIPSSNLYSYTCPEFPFLNHHWLSGVIFFAVVKICGFTGLSVFALFLWVVTFLLFFHIALRSSNFETAALVFLLTLPLFVSRAEIRPELFSYFLSAVFFWILWNYSYGRIHRGWVFLLPALEIFWVNLHIYFILGPLLIGLFLAGSLLPKGRMFALSVKTLIFALVLSIVAALVNPYGIKLALYPFYIGKEYLNLPFDQQSFFTLQKDIGNGLLVFPPLDYFKLALGLLLASWFFVLFRIKKERQNFLVTNIMLSLFFAAIAIAAVRNFALFGYFALCIISVNLRGILKWETHNKRGKFIFFFLFVLILSNLFLFCPQYWPKKEDLGIGLKKGASGAADFFMKERLAGAVFNNYDIGSYLIYYLYPRCRVFIDNRPEAYPRFFLNGVYIAMQEKEKVWQDADKRYQFNAIFFYRKVQSPWGQNFLIRRVFDPLWAPVYVDDFCIILLKRNALNQGLIQKYELPKEMFSAVKVR